MKEVCGGFFVDNFDAAASEFEFFDLYFPTQVLHCTGNLTFFGVFFPFDGGAGAKGGYDCS